MKNQKQKQTQIVKQSQNVKVSVKLSKKKTKRSKGRRSVMKMPPMPAPIYNYTYGQMSAPFSAPSMNYNPDPNSLRNPNTTLGATDGVNLLTNVAISELARRQIGTNEARRGSGNPRERSMNQRSYSAAPGGGLVEAKLVRNFCLFVFKFIICRNRRNQRQSYQELG